MTDPPVLPSKRVQMFVQVVKRLYGPLVRRAAREFLQGRLLDPQEPAQGRRLRGDVDRFVGATWTRVDEKIQSLGQMKAALERVASKCKGRGPTSECSIARRLPMPDVELIYDKDCPNIETARSQLLRAFAEADVKARWKEWRTDDPDAPSHVHGYGSPTVLVNGKDVAGHEPDLNGPSCRIYAAGDLAVNGAPSVESIIAALSGERETSSTWATRLPGWRSSGAMIPALGVALLPKAACPACFPLYAGVLSVLGLGFLLQTTYLLPITIAFLGIALAALGFRASQRRGYGPFFLGVISAVVLVVGKFSFGNDLAMYTGLGALIAASLWNSWPKPKVGSGACPACAPNAASSD
jgi:mercuric ion transport protein